MEAFVVVSIAGVVIVGAIALESRARKQREAVWALIAEERGGSFVPGSGFFSSIQAKLYAGNAMVDMYTTGSGKQKQNWTRWSASFQFGPGTEFRIYREGFFSSLGKKLGTQDVILGGHTGFDDHFMVKCDDAPTLRAIWSPQAKDQMMASFSTCRIEGDSMQVRLIISGLCKDQALLEAGLDLMETLTTHDFLGQQALASLSSVSILNGRPTTTLTVPTKVVISTTVIGDKLATQARLIERTSIADTNIRFDERGEIESGRLSTLPQGAQVHAANLSAGTLAIAGGSAQFTWHGVEHNPEKIRAGAQLLGALVAVKDGVFR